MTKSKKKLPYNGRDYNLVNLLRGATKSYVEKDHKKEANKKTSRSKVDPAEFDGDSGFCIQCGIPYNIGGSIDQNELAAMECGYCSVTCMDYFTTKE